MLARPEFLWMREERKGLVLATLEFGIPKKEAVSSCCYFGGPSSLCFSVDFVFYFSTCYIFLFGTMFWFHP